MTIIRRVATGSSALAYTNSSTDSALGSARPRPSAAGTGTRGPRRARTRPQRAPTRHRLAVAEGVSASAGGQRRADRRDRVTVAILQPPRLVDGLGRDARGREHAIPLGLGEGRRVAAERIAWDGIPAGRATTVKSVDTASPAAL